MSDFLDKDKSELIDEKLMGLEINDGDKCYGIIIRIDQINSDFKVYTNLGYSFNAGLILNLVALSNLYEKAAEERESNEYDNIHYLSPAWRENTKLSRKIMSRPKPMAHTKSLRSNGSINNNATVSNDTVINITSHTSNSESFVEDYHYKNKQEKKLLTIDEICERNGITVEQYINSRKNGGNND